MKKYYQIGNLCILILVPDSLQIPETFQKFEVAAEVFHNKYVYEYEIVFVQELPKSMEKSIFQSEDIIVYSTPCGEKRKIGIRNSNWWYAYYEDVSDRSAKISLLQEFQEICWNEVVFLSLLCLEKRLIANGKFTLHCSFLVLDGKAILLSGPSGVGKTTQANLWCDYTNARVVNGDRALLEWNEGKWYASGWPVCGTSGICENESWPLQAIIMLEQSDNNQLISLKPMAAFQEVYPQITVNRWNPKQTDKALDMMNHLIMEIPIFKLKCTISQEAVECGKQVL